MVKVVISRDSWEHFYLGGDQRVGTVELSQYELDSIRDIMRLWMRAQKFLSDKYHSSKPKVTEK